MFRSVFRLLPVFVVCWLARRYAPVRSYGTDAMWHTPWDDVLVLSREDLRAIRIIHKARRLREQLNRLENQSGETTDVR